MHERQTLYKKEKTVAAVLFSIKPLKKMVLFVFCPNMGLTYVSTIWYSDFFSATVPNETDSFRKGQAA